LGEIRESAGTIFPVMTKVNKELVRGIDAV
jgi:hypothetical protein